MGAHRVVIIGGGFGGLLAAKALKRAPVDVTLIDRRNFHLFQPLLYQVATGSLAPGEIAAPLRSVLKRQANTRVLLGEVADVDPQRNLIVMRDETEISYDSLIVATGSQSSYFGHEHWREWAPSLKTVEEATAVRHKILYAFEAAERIEDPEERRAWLTFTIVGAGATGVEMAGAVAEIARHTLRRDFRSIRPAEAQIIILDGSPRVLPNYPENLSARAERSLIKLGVRVRNNTRVTAIDRDGVNFQSADGTTTRLSSKTVLWAGGVQPSQFLRQLADRLGVPLDRTGRMPVNPDMSVPGHPSIYLAGDIALAKWPDGKPLPGVCQVAMQQGTYVARTIVKRIHGEQNIKPFSYFDKGDMAVIGRGAAVAKIFGFEIWGWPAWMVWLFIHLMYLVEFQSRLVVFLRWGIHYATFSRGARLITGSVPTDVLDEPAPTADAP